MPATGEESDEELDYEDEEEEQADLADTAMFVTSEGTYGASFEFSEDDLKMLESAFNLFDSDGR